MDAWGIVAFILFMLFCAILSVAGYTKPVPPADEKKKEKNKN